MSDIARVKKGFSFKELLKKCKEKSKISVHFSFALLMIVGCFFGLGKLLFSYFVCLVFHEMVHYFVAKKLGYKLGAIRLSMTGAVLDAKQDEFSFKDEILIAISAPLVNLVVGFLLVSFWWIVPESYNFLQDLAVINFAIFGFNILPFFPLDGGRVLLGFLSKKTQRKNALKLCRAITICASILLFIFFVFSLFVSPLFSLGVGAINLFVSAIVEDKNAVYHKLFYTERKLQKSKSGGIESQEIIVHKSVRFAGMLKMVDARHFTTFVIVDDNFNVVSKVKENQLAQLIEKENMDFHS